MNDHNHNEHRPIFQNNLFICTCGKSNNECHPCRRPNENCLYKDVGCQHPKRCEAMAGPYPDDNNTLHSTIDNHST